MSPEKMVLTLARIFPSEGWYLFETEIHEVILRRFLCKNVQYPYEYIHFQANPADIRVIWTKLNFVFPFIEFEYYWQDYFININNPSAFSLFSISRYIAPLAVTVYVYVKASRELERPLAMGIYQPRISDTHSRAERTLSSEAQLILLNS